MFFQNYLENGTPGQTSVTGSHNEPRSDQEFCYCKGPQEGTIIASDNPNCMIEWFHLECLKIQSVPKGKSKWYCPDCRKLPEFTRKKKKDSLEDNIAIILFHRYLCFIKLDSLFIYSLVSLISTQSIFFVNTI